MEIEEMKRKVENRSNTSSIDNVSSKNKEMNGSSEEIEQSANVNSFSADETEVMGRILSQEYEDDQQGRMRTMCRYMKDDQDQAPNPQSEVP